ncbi:MAG: hypothetical protein V7637_1835 [Mycobacteriales bacterium]
MRRHEPDLVSFIFGLFFVGAAAIWGLSAVPGHPVRGWALPALLIVVGAVGLLTSLAVRRPRSTDHPDSADLP